MKKIMFATSLAAIALAMLLSVTNQVNATRVNHAIFAQGGKLPSPPPSGPGGFTASIHDSGFAQGGKLPSPPPSGPGGLV